VNFSQSVRRRPFNMNYAVSGLLRWKFGCGHSSFLAFRLDLVEKRLGPIGSSIRSDQHSITSVHLCRESTCARTLLLGFALYRLSMPHLIEYPSLAFLLSFAYESDCVPERQSRRWPFYRPNRRRRHSALLLSNSRRSDIWCK
jgi:hypothetical protein